jgi:hypothetical protein
MKRVSFIFFFCLSIALNISAQSLSPKCLFIPEPEEEVTTIQGLPEDTINGIYLIPVVFHVIYNDTIDNISDFQIFNGLQLLNEDFRKLNADTTDIITPFKNIAADAKIEFRLAQIDPNGNPTNGITRTYTDSIEFTNLWDAYYDSTGGIDAWPTDKYLNIRLVKKFAGIIAGGRGSGPSNLNPQLQGIIITNNMIGDTGTSPAHARVFTHECGHFLNLYHMWAYLGAVGDTANCSLDDGVSDTPNCFGSSYTLGSPSGLWAESCGTLDNVQNYMSYSGYFVPRMFTHGQVDRMHLALNSSVGARDSLHTYNNLIETGIINPTSIYQLANNVGNFHIYPNPSHNIINIDNDKFVINKVEILDNLGRKVNSYLLNQKRATLSIAEFNKGFYFLKIYYKHGSRIHKIVIH